MWEEKDYIEMNKWEYLFVTCEVPEDRSGWKPTIINHVVVDGWEDGPLIDEFANQSGEEGWELVSYEPVVRSKSLGVMSGVQLFNALDQIRMVFKRPKE